MTALRITDLLIAPPSMPDPRFRDTVLLIISHNDTGTVALCLNKLLDLETSDLEELQDPNDVSAMSHPIHWGGPVGKESVWMLHDDQWSSDNTLDLAPGIRLSSDLAMLEAIKNGDCPRSFRLFSGFASWAPGQLAQELEGQRPWHKNHSWLVAPVCDLEILFDCPIDDLWQMACSLCAQTAVDSWLN